MSICVICGAEYQQPKYYEKKTCSATCGSALVYASTRTMVNCENCSKEFQTRIKKPQKFCSTECFHTSRIGVANPTGGNHAPVTWYEKECGQCVVKFKTKIEEQIYCSRACLGMSQRKMRICPCGNEFWFGNAVDNNVKFCSDFCKNLYSGTNSTPEIRMLKSAVLKEEWEEIPDLIEKAIAVKEGCWVFPYKGDTGYGILQIDTPQKHLRIKVHRLMMQALNGGIDVDGVVHHKCANRRCCNPDHLQVTTHAENTAEMLERKNYKALIEAQAARIAELEARLAN